MTTALSARNAKINTIRDLLMHENTQAKIAMVAPQHLTPERIVRIAMTSIQRNPKLADCTPQSLLGALLTCTQIGLEPDSVAQFAHLIPFKDQCTLIIGYKGLKVLAERHPEVRRIEPPQLVYEKDEYTYERGLTPRLEHRPLNKPDRGEVVAVYVIARLADGTTEFEWMWRQDVEIIQRRSKASKDGPWVTDWNEMARKTVLRRLCKHLPSSAELSTAVAINERAEVGVAQGIDFVDVEAEPESATAGEIEKSLTKESESPTKKKSAAKDEVRLVRMAILNNWAKMKQQQRANVLKNCELTDIGDIEKIDDLDALRSVRDAMISA